MTGHVTSIDVPAIHAFTYVREVTGVRETELASPRQQRALARPRALFAWILRKQGVSYVRIARALGRNPPTVQGLIRVAEELRKVDPSFAASCDRYFRQPANTEGTSR